MTCMCSWQMNCSGLMNARPKYRSDGALQGAVAIETMDRRWHTWYRLLMVALYVSLAAAIAYMWYTDTSDFRGLNGFYKATFSAFVYGTANKPFVLRALVPSLIRWITAALPGGVLWFLRVRVYELYPDVLRMLTILEWEPEFLPEYLVGFALVFLAVLGYLLALRRLGQHNYSMDRWLVDALPLFSLAVLPACFKRGTHFLYDMPALCLFTVGLVLIQTRRLRPYYVLLVVALFNKETAVLLAMVFAIYHRRDMPWWKLALHVIVQVGLAVAIRQYLSHVYAANPGPHFEWHLKQNIKLYLRPYGFSTMLSIVAIVLLLGHRFRQRPRYLREALWIGIPLFGSYMPMGVWAEVRVFYEIYPVLFLLGFPPLARVMGWRMAALVSSVETQPSL